MKVIISISIESELLNRIDKKRGLIPRSSWIEFQLEKVIKNSGGSNGN